MAAETRFYVKGTLANPSILARSKWPPPAVPNDPPHVHFDPVIDDWRDSPLVGGWILNGDLRLTEIHAADVDGVKARLRTRYADLLPRLGWDIAASWGIGRDHFAAA